MLFNNQFEHWAREQRNKKKKKWNNANNNSNSSRIERNKKNGHKLLKTEKLPFDVLRIYEDRFVCWTDQAILRVFRNDSNNNKKKNANKNLYVYY